MEYVGENLVLYNCGWEIYILERCGLFLELDEWCRLYTNVKRSSLHPLLRIVKIPRTWWYWPNNTQILHFLC